MSFFRKQCLHYRVLAELYLVPRILQIWRHGAQTRRVATPQAPEMCVEVVYWLHKHVLKVFITL